MISRNSIVSRAESVFHIIPNARSRTKDGQGSRKQLALALKLKRDVRCYGFYSYS